MTKRYVSNDGDWPKPCPGGCGRVMRAPHMKAAQFPGRQTFQAVNNGGMCATCAGRKRDRTEKPVETEEARLRRMRADIEAMVRDRRRRGVPPEGIAMPGETLDDPDRSRPMPAPDQPLEDPEAPLGRCKHGHAFTKLDSVGHRFCPTCHENKVQAARARMMVLADEKIGHKIDRSPSPEAPYGRCLLGHPYKSENGKLKKQRYCSTCKKAAARARYYRKANQEARARRAAA